MASVIPCLKRFPVLPSILLALFSVCSFAGAETKAAEEAGAVLFRDKGCTHCHGVGGVGTKKAPALVDLRKDKQWTPARITNQILNGGQKMPPFSDSVTDEDAAQLVAYLRAKHRPIPPPAPDPEQSTR
jgi:mono/diheme cytochrome c family protein